MKTPLEDILAVLNTAYAADPAAIHALMCNRVPCNRELGDHPTVQVDTNPVTSGETLAVGALGLINGIVETLTGKRVEIAFSAEKDERGVSKMLGFKEYTPPVNTSQADEFFNLTVQQLENKLGGDGIKERNGVRWVYWWDDMRGQGSGVDEFVRPATARDEEIYRRIRRLKGD